MLAAPADATRLALLFANRSERDILVRHELEALRDAHPDRFRLWYTVSGAAAAGW